MEGDQAAAEAGFEELYQAHFGSIYDFSIRLAQDRNTAALVVQSVFLRALRAFRSGQGDGLELQLYTAAHLDTAERLRGSRGDAEQVEEPYAAVDVSRLATPTQDVVEMGRLVWSAAGALKLNDYELLDLSVRHKLDNNDIANVLRGRPETVERKLKDAQAQLEQAFTARLLFAQGRRECLDLDFDLGDTEWSKSLPRRILRHGQSCEVCKATIASQPTSIDLLGALMPVPAPAGWQQTMLDRLKEAVRDEPIAPAAAAAAAGALATGAAMATRTSAADQPEAEAASEQSELKPLPEGGGAIGGFALGAWLSSTFGDGGPRGPLLALLLGGLLMFVIVFGAVCVAGTFGGDGDEEETREPTRTATMTPTAEASGTPTVTRTPTETATLELVAQPTVPPVPPVPTQAPPPIAPPPTAPPPPTATTAPPPTATTAPPPTLPPPTEVPPAPTP